VIVTAILFLITVVEKDNHIRFYMLLVVLLSRNTNSLLVQGQVTWLVVFGLALIIKGLRLKSHASYVVGSGLTCLFSIPPNTIPLIFWTIWQMRQWDKKDIVKVFVIPIVVFIVSLGVYGIGWPVSMVRSWELAPGTQANMSVWRYEFWYVVVTGVVVTTVILYYRNRRFDLSWMVMCTYLLSPYVLGYRLVVPLIVALPVVLRFNRFIAFALLAASYTRILIGGVGWWYESWVLACFLAVALFFDGSDYDRDTPVAFTSVR
jgi:hypothetical protein